MINASVKEMVKAKREKKVKYVFVPAGEEAPAGSRDIPAA